MQIKGRFCPCPIAASLHRAHNRLRGNTPASPDKERSSSARRRISELLVESISIRWECDGSTCIAQDGQTKIPGRCDR